MHRKLYRKDGTRGNVQCDFGHRVILLTSVRFFILGVSKTYPYIKPLQGCKTLSAGDINELLYIMQ